jgi:hypothetical protein
MRMNGTRIFPYPHSITPCIVIYVFCVHTFANFAVLLDTIFCLCLITVQSSNKDKFVLALTSGARQDRGTMAP